MPTDSGLLSRKQGKLYGTDVLYLDKDKFKSYFTLQHLLKYQKLVIKGKDKFIISMYDKHKMKRNEIRADSFFLFIRKVYADDKLRLSFVHRCQNSVAGFNSSMNTR